MDSRKLRAIDIPNVTFLVTDGTQVNLNITSFITNQSLRKIEIDTPGCA